MRKSVIILCMFLLSAAPVFADEVDQGLPKQTSEQLKTNTREMIRLGADSDDAVKMTRLMVQKRFQVENAIQAQEIVMNALKQGLPAEPVMNKAYEGMAKGVQAGSVVQAMEKTRARYAYAYEKAKGLEQDPDETALTGEVIAEGMAAGLKNEDADRICDQLQTRSQDRVKDGEGDKKQDRDREQKQLHTLAQECFMTVREMARRGVPSDAAADAVCEALQNNYQAPEMQQLRKAFMNNAAHGDPVQIANRYTYALRHGTSADDLETAGKYGRESSGSGMSGSQGMGSSSSGSGMSGSQGMGSGGTDSGSAAGESSSGGSGSGSDGSGSGSGGSGSGGSGSGQGGRK